MRSAFPRENELQGEYSRALGSFISNKVDEQRDQSDLDAGRALHALTRELMMKYLQSERS